jgi:hypothetical protein
MSAKKTTPKHTTLTQAANAGTAKKVTATKPKKPRTAAAGKKLSAIAAAARVLDETGRAMTCPELIKAMAAKRYWSSPGGKTPAATLYAAIHQEIKTKGKEARFRKTERGKFASTGVA